MCLKYIFKYTNVFKYVFKYICIYIVPITGRQALSSNMRIIILLLLIV